MATDGMGGAGFGGYAVQIVRFVGFCGGEGGGWEEVGVVEGGHCEVCWVGFEMEMEMWCGEVLVFKWQEERKKTS
jgi:hypothetical protein